MNDKYPGITSGDSYRFPSSVHKLTIKSNMEYNMDYNEVVYINYI